jgi:hypothetical protein
MQAQLAANIVQRAKNCLVPPVNSIKGTNSGDAAMIFGAQIMKPAY